MRRPAQNGPNRGQPVNFVHLRAADYEQVQNQLFDLVRVHLPGGAGDTYEERDESAVNLGLHIRRGRGAEQVPMPLDVLMSHGLADKSYLLLRHVETGRPLLNDYEHVLVPGEWFRERLLRRRWRLDSGKRMTLGPDRVHVVGWPRLDPLFQAPAPPPAGDRPLRVLWAPSHDAQKVGAQRRPLSSYPAFEQFLPMLRERFDVQVSLHPANRTTKTPTTEPLLWADAVISDFGTMLYEAWALDKCVVMPSWLMPEEVVTADRFKRSAEGVVYSRRIGNHAGSIGELVEMLAANEPPGSDVREFMGHYLAPEHRGTSGRRIAELLPTLPLRRNVSRAVRR